MVITMNVNYIEGGKLKTFTTITSVSFERNGEFEVTLRNGKKKQKPLSTLLDVVE